jgi:CDP-paratose 2-epimerase
MGRMLVTGGAGFVGSNVAVHLKNKGHEVVVMDNLVRRGSELNLEIFKTKGIQFVHGDIRNAEDLNHLSGKFDFIFETAAQPAACTGYANPVFDITNNYLGLLNVLEYARNNGSALIFWSTNKTYSGEAINALPLLEKLTRYVFDMAHSELTDWGQVIAANGIPENFSVDGGDHSIYGLSKICADLTCQEWAKAFGVKVVINRFSCLAGPGQFGKSEQGWVAWFVIAALFNLPLTFYGFKGKQVRDVLFVDDILNLIDAQMENIDKIGGEVFNVGGGMKVNTSLIECVNLIEDVTGKRITTSYDPTQRKADQCVYISDIRKAKRVLNWEPKIDMTTGIAQIAAWVIANQDSLKKLYSL